jgi:hypothetical protein
MTQENPAQFGITPAMIEKIKADHPDLDPSKPSLSNLSWWEFVRYEAQKLGWVRVGSEQEMQEVAMPYVYADTIPHAKEAIRMMRLKGIVKDAVEIEINNPDEPVEGYGDFYTLTSKMEISKFMRSVW